MWEPPGEKVHPPYRLILLSEVMPWWIVLDINWLLRHHVLHWQWQYLTCMLLCQPSSRQQTYPGPFGGAQVTWVVSSTFAGLHGISVAEASPGNLCRYLFFQMTQRTELLIYQNYGLSITCLCIFCSWSAYLHPLACSKHRHVAVRPLGLYHTWKWACHGLAGKICGL